VALATEPFVVVALATERWARNESPTTNSVTKIVPVALERLTSPFYSVNIKNKMSLRPGAFPKKGSLLIFEYQPLVQRIREING